MGKLNIEIRELMRNDDSIDYECVMSANKINKVHTMRILASAIHQLTDGENKDELMIIFLEELIKGK